MCGRFNLIATGRQIMDHFGLLSLPAHNPDYNIPPGQKILAVVQLEEGSKKAVNLHWSLIPSWSHDSKNSRHLINARAESLLEKPSFRNAYQHRRCLIPATGFFEWQHSRTEPAPGRFSAYTPSLAIAEPAPGRFSAYTPSLAITGKRPYHVH
jgi:putative SOS response-associated peptidase YedK